MKTMLFPIVVECMEEGGYYAECSILQGCHVEGETYSEAIENIQDAIKIFLDSYQELGKKIPQFPVYEGNVMIASGIPILQEA
ncbi:type II toxin-antitoxin system HicB family antitoxin [bacterium]|nr:type II toxin-antitoxin system HicB family antitoxin [bacterium]MBU1599095.1 type II toxin-antitoxin system HicB family antitoxin [bacterium]